MLQLDEFAIREITHCSYGQGWREQGITPRKGIYTFDLHNYSGGIPCQASYGRKGWNDNIKILVCFRKSNCLVKTGINCFRFELDTRRRL